MRIPSLPSAALSLGVASARAIIAASTVRQRLFGVSVSLTMTGSMTVTCGQAGAAPVTPSASSNPVVPHASLAYGGFAALNAVTRPAQISLSGLNRTLHSPTNVVQAAANKVIGGNNLNLNSGAPLFSAGGLAGFHSMILDIGGKQEQISLNTKLSAAELIAAEQVESSGKQELKINSAGVATGGYFDLNGGTVSALDSVLGGQVVSLVISHGVNAVDTLSVLDLSGSLINMGSITVGAAAGAKGPNVDTITAANMYNGSGGVISSALATGSSRPAAIGLTATGTFYNSGLVTSGGELNISAPTIQNVAGGVRAGVSLGQSGLAAASHGVPVLSAQQDVYLQTQSATNGGLIVSKMGSVDLDNGGTSNNLTVLGGGTILAHNGDINFNQAGNTGSGNITLGGGNYISKQLNFNAGSGTIQANVDQITGVVNGSAAASHITAATEDLRLGTICVTGDPTYYNTGGDIVISGALTGAPDLALVASGNIYANGGSLDTSAVTQGGGAFLGGTIFLAAGANISGVTGNNNGFPDTGSIVTLSNNTSNPHLGSVTGGFIDLSGITFTGQKDAPLTKIDSSGTVGSGGNITMVAYQGKGKDSGDIQATATASQVGGTPTVNSGGATGGTVLLLGGGTVISAQNINAEYVSVYGLAPTLSGNLTIQNGVVSGSQFSVSGNIGTGTKTAINVSDISAYGIYISTGGKVTANNLLATGPAGVVGVINGDGQIGGSVQIGASAITVNNVNTSGGGGAGGSAPGANGGIGAAAGNITLSSFSGDLTILGQLAACGGGGGGGAGADSSGTVGSGGAGGAAGYIRLMASGSIIVSSPSASSSAAILAYDGGSGGSGGLGTGGGGGGGGGGGSAFSGGGGGAGATGTSGGGVGGGGGGGLGAGGGGGGATTGSVPSATGGGGGLAFGATGPVGGSGGVGSPAGNAGAGHATLTGQGGAGGGSTGPTNGGGGADFKGGAGGANGDGTVSSGINGQDAPTSNVAGGINILIGSALGSASKPFLLDAANIYLGSSLGKSASFYVASNAPSISTFSASAGTGTVVFDAKQGVIENTSASGSVVSISAALGINTTFGYQISATKSVTLTAASGDIDYDGSISSKTLTMMATNGSITGLSGGISSSSVAVQAGGPMVDLHLQLLTGATTPFSILESSVGNGGTFTINSNEQLNVTGSITAINGIVNLQANGPVTTGIGILAPINTGSTSGQVNLQTQFGNITATKPVVAADTTITSGGSIGSASHPFLANTSTLLTANAGSTTPSYITDSSTETFGITGVGLAGGSINIVTAAKTVSVNALAYSNVTLQDTFSTAGSSPSVVVTNNTGDKVGDGTGVVSITTALADINPGAAGSGIFGTSVVLKSTLGNVGESGPLLLTTPSVAASAVKGSVDVSDTQAATLNVGSALASYTVNAPVLIVAGNISGGAVVLASSAGGISQDKGVIISGGAITLTAGVGNIGAVGQSLMTEASSTLTINGAANSLNYIYQTGEATLAASSGMGSSTLTLTDKSALSVTGTVGFSTVNLTAPSVSVAATGSVTCSSLTVIAPVVTVDAVGGLMVATSASFKSNSALSIVVNGPGTIIMAQGSDLTLGAIGTGLTTTSIALGNAKTGVGNPFVSAFNTTGATPTLNDLTIATTGNFTSSAKTIALNDAGAGGTLSITAGNFIALGNTSFSPISLQANGASGLTGGAIILNLNGTQPVTLDSNAGTSSAGTPFQLQVNAGNIGVGGGGAAGSVSVNTKGNLTVYGGGIALQAIANGGALVMTSAKDLAVNSDMLNSGLGYSSITLSSGGTGSFAVDSGGSSVTNGTVGSIAANTIKLNSTGIITTLAAGCIDATTNLTLSNTSGALSLSGTPGDILVPVNLALTAKSGITLGDPKLGSSNPLLNILDSKTLSSLTVKTGGNFTSADAAFELSEAGAGGTLNFTAGNIIALGNTTNQSIVFSANGASGAAAGIISLTLTGTQAVTVDFGAAPVKSAPFYALQDNGSAGSGSVSVMTADALTVDAGGVVVPATGASLYLSGGKALAITDLNLLTANSLSNVTLASYGSTAFVVGAPVAAGGNGIASNVSAGTVTLIGAGGITISAGATVTVSSGSTLQIEAKSFTNEGTVTGTSLSTLMVSDVSGSGLNIINPGNLSGFSALAVDTKGAMTFGTLLTALAPLNSLDITATGSVTFDPTNPSITTANNATITIVAGSLLSTSATPIVFYDAGSSAVVSITTTSSLNVGVGKGTFGISVDPTGSVVNLASTAGTLTLSGGLSPIGSGQLAAPSIAVNQQVTANTTLSAFATGKSGSILTPVGDGLLASTLTIGTNNGALSKAATNISAPTVLMGGLLVGLSVPLQGALNLSNANGGTPNVSGLNPIAALTYSSAVGTVGSIDTINGGINITATANSGNLSVNAGAVLQTNGGGISLIILGQTSHLDVGSGAQLLTNAGSVTLQALGVNGNNMIDIGTNVTIHASGTAKGVGQVSIVFDAIPTKGLVPGAPPAPSPPTIEELDGGTVTYATTDGPTASITAKNSNTLIADGRNIVFNLNGATLTAITLEGGDLIIADPPAGSSAAAAAHSPDFPGVAAFSGGILEASSSRDAITISALPNAFSAPGPGAGNDGQLGSIVGLSDLASLNSRHTVAQYARPEIVSRTMSGKVSNAAERRLDTGPMLIAPDVDTAVHTSFGSVDVAANAVALIIAFDGGIAVYNLHDVKRNSVVINCADHRIGITPGKNAVVTGRNIHYFEDVNPAEFVGYRRVEGKSYEDGMKTFQSEFDFFSMMRGLAPLRQLVQSSEPHCKKVTRSMFKTAAILQSLGDATPFVCMPARPIAAMADTSHPCGPLGARQ